MWRSVEVRLAGDHPAARGHFPSNPIIPGALLLDEVVKAIAEVDGRRGEITIRVAKFFRPVRPGDQMRVQWQPLCEAVVTFECRLAGSEGLAVSGTLEIGPTRP